VSPEPRGRRATARSVPSGRAPGVGRTARPPRPAAASEKGRNSEVGRPDRLGRASSSNGADRSKGRSAARPTARSGARSGGGVGGPKATRPTSRRGRGELGGTQIEGRRAVAALLRAGRRRVRELWVLDAPASGAPAFGALEEIVDLAVARSVPVRRVSAGAFAAEARSDAPQGVLARADPLPVADLADLARGGPGRPAFLVVAEGVTDPHNLGALLRAAEVAGATGAVLPAHRAVGVTPVVAKAAAGAVEHLPVALVAGVPSALQDLSELGVWTVGLAPEATRSIYEVDIWSEPVALVLGAEGHGLSRLARARCDLVVRIPEHGHETSLNVAAAAAVACFEVARRRLG